MTIVAVVGDCTTTTCLAMSACWPADDRPVIVEADPSGGSLAAWLDVPVAPSLSTIVARTQAHAGTSGTGGLRWSAIESLVRRTPTGPSFIPTPARAREARRAVLEASTSVLPSMTDVDAPTALVDLGRHSPGASTPAGLTLAATVVVCHRQEPASIPAAAVRLDRVAELVASLIADDKSLLLATIGDRPFASSEIAQLVERVAGRTIPVVALADDPLAAAVFAGRSGVSARRLRRLPLMRTTTTLVDATRALLDARPHDQAEVG